MEKTCATSEYMKCEDDVEYGDQCREHVDVAEQDEHVDLDVGPRHEDHQVADRFYFFESFYVEQTSNEHSHDEQAFQYLHRVVIDNVGDGEDRESEQAEE
jgi:hypothetical protein